MFLLSSLFKASRNSFFFLPVSFKLRRISFTGICGLPSIACLLWRCFTIDRSSLPHLQVVLRMRTTMALMSFFSAPVFPVKCSSRHHAYVLSAFLGFALSV